MQFSSRNQRENLRNCFNSGSSSSSSSTNKLVILTIFCARSVVTNIFVQFFRIKEGSVLTLKLSWHLRILLTFITGFGVLF